MALLFFFVPASVTTASSGSSTVYLQCPNESVLNLDSNCSFIPIRDHQFPSFPVRLSFLVFIFMLLRIWSKSEDKKSNSVAPPGPWKLPLIGNMHRMIGSLPHCRLLDLATKYGPIMHLQLGEVSTVIFSSPEVAKEVLKTNDIKFATSYSLAADIIYYNIKNIGFAPYGEYRRQMRKICIMEVFSGRRVQAAQPIREEEVLEFVKSISLKAR
ncbi:cytochrome P450 71D7-like [Tripterygium wilfordii]|uniref:cytochrome P450 71D7-like n=1 Tax=Tripterygium wilfordii TaxID=458696 RepID=UPI0018F8336A|nr:cytochrome P450 71D7-like [Tripterygium wilfordii]